MFALLLRESENLSQNEKKKKKLNSAHNFYLHVQKTQNMQILIKWMTLKIIKIKLLINYKSNNKTRR